MALPIADLRFTTRRNGAEPPWLYPRLLRDRSVLPKIDIAVQYFESMLGRQRRDFDAEVLVHFFGDHRLTRGLVAALARTYRFRSPMLAEVVSSEALERLRRDGIASPRELRLQLFDRVNDFGFGFLPPAERGSVLGQLERELALPAGQLETLLQLDADECAELVRVGAEPEPGDVQAHYNVSVLFSMLRYAERVELRLNPRSNDLPDAALRLCAANGVEASAEREGPAVLLTLRGRPDALGQWVRHGRRVARCVVLLLERERAAISEGSAELVLRRRRLILRLTPELLDFLAGSDRPAGWDDLLGWDQPAFSPPLRGATLPPGWSFRRWPEPEGWRAGTLVPDAALRIGSRRVLVCGVRSPGHAERLAAIASRARTGDPLLFVGPRPALGPLEAVGAATVVCNSAHPSELPRALRHWLARGGGPVALAQPA